ncbi:Hypothetical predicted protein [Cloeon dipterum]|uniref:Ig-like domain-containing protein n=1 Tax=Cloeon dipterum TaxID=197152 RepID=A0A8S1D531_9INSE|nr:Hypothetical predicted protein [Cloeon dipterum]
MDEELLARLKFPSQTLFNDLPHNISTDLIEKLNSGEGCSLIAERLNECYANQLSSEIRAEELIPVLIMRMIPVGLFATLLYDMDLYEPLSALLQPETLAITIEPGNGQERLECELEGTLRLTCAARGVPLPNIKWWRDNTEIASTGDSNFEVSCVETTVTSSLVIRNFSPDLQGKYFCIVTSDALNSASIRSVEVDVDVKFSKPVIVEEPDNACVFEPGPITLSCTAKGYPLPKYQWYFNNLVLFDQTESTLRIGTSSPKKHTGKYRCIATNAAGSVESKEVIVNVPEEFLMKIESSKMLKAVEKIALLIANEEGNLQKPINDVILLARKLEKIGFKTLPLINLDFKDMTNAIERFSGLLKPGVYGLFYYAGHGCQRGSEIFIPPYKALEMCSVGDSCCSASSESKKDAKWITDTYILDKLLTNKPKMRIVILDMCLKYSGCPRCEFPVLTYPPSVQPDLNYMKVCATSKNLSAYESQSRPNSNYMTEFSKYIDPDMPFKVTRIFYEVNKVISQKEAKVPSENNRQIPSISTNIYEDFTLLDPVTGDEEITDYFTSINILPEGEIFHFENKGENFMLKAQVKYKPYKKYILNSLVLIFEGIDFDTWDLDVRTDMEILGIGESYVIVGTDQPNEFVVHHLQKYTAGINLSVYLLEKSGNLVASHNLFIYQPLITRG